MFLRKLFVLFNLLFLFIGCEANDFMVCGGDEECNDCYLTISAPDLEIDNNGYYHIDFINSDIQTFTTLKSETGFYYEKIWWFSNTMHLAQHGTNENWEYLVNTSSYTNDEGI